MRKLRKRRKILEKILPVLMRMMVKVAMEKYNKRLLMRRNLDIFKK